jgi:hypothetical protein
MKKKFPVTVAKFLTLLLLVCPVFVNGQSWCDILHLKNGKSIEGIIELTLDGYKITEDKSSYVIPVTQVIRWEKKILPEEEYGLRLNELDENNVEENYILALWCQVHGLDDKAENHFEKVFELSPNHKQARRAAGYIKYKGKWIEHKKYMRLKGYKKYNGRWLEKEIADAKIAKDKERRKRARAARHIRKLVKILSSEREGCNVRKITNEMIELYPVARIPVQQAATHYSSRVRRVAIDAVSARPEKSSAKILCNRAFNEKSVKMQECVAGGLSRHSRRKMILTSLVDKITDTDNPILFARLVYYIKAIDDKRAVDLLINKIPETNPKEDSSATVQDSEELKSADEKEKLISTLPEWIKNNPEKFEKAKAAIERKLEQMKTKSEESEGQISYPRRALIKLTGIDLGKSRKDWQEWWKGEKDVFAFGEAQPVVTRRMSVTTPMGKIGKQTSMRKLVGY